MCENVVVFPAPEECRRALEFFQPLAECPMGTVGEGLRLAFKAAHASRDGASSESGSGSGSGSESGSHGSMDADDEEVAREEEEAEEKAKEEDRFGFNIEEDFQASGQCGAPCWMGRLMFMSDDMVVAGASVEDSYRLFVPQPHFDCVVKPDRVPGPGSDSDSDSDSHSHSRSHSHSEEGGKEEE